MSEKWITFQYAFGDPCVFFHWVLFCENLLQGEGEGHFAFSVLLEQCMPFCSVGRRNKIDEFSNRKCANIPFPHFQGNPAFPHAQEHSISFINFLAFH